MVFSDDLFQRIDLALRQAESRARAPSPAARQADSKKAGDLERRCHAAMVKARAALTRGRRGRRAVRGDLKIAEEEAARHRRQAESLREESRRLREREKGRHDAAKKLARLFARTLSENGDLRTELALAMRAAGPKLAESELELSESRDTVVNLMLQLSRERRRWKAAILSVRRRIKGTKPSAKLAAKRLDELEAELAESQETAAKLLVELTRRGRRADAERLLGQRAKRRSDDETHNRGYAVAPAIALASARFEEGLRAVVESPAMDPEAVSLVARQGMALTRTLRLAAEITDGLPTAPESGGLIRERLDRCLDQWESEAGRRQLTIIRRFDKNLPSALVPLGGFESVLDELYGGAIARAPRNTVIVAAAGQVDGSLSISVQDAGMSGPERAPGALESLAFALSRELVERWGGKLMTAVTAGGRGRLATLILAVKKSGS